MVDRINGFLEQVHQSLVSTFTRQKKYWRVWLALLGVILLVLMFLAAYLRMKGWGWAEWTGFVPYTGDLDKDDHEKTLWDWMQLLIIPAVLALVALFFNRQERQNESRIATARNQETGLQNYLDKMSELILEKQLMDVKSTWKNMRNITGNQPSAAVFDEALPAQQRAVRDMAQVRTVTVLRQMDRNRRNIVFQFLRDADLADFLLISASLDGADLSGANLSHTNLYEADLRGACMVGTNLNNANLMEAIMHNTNLQKADLCGTNLSGANLAGVDLSRAKITYTNLNRALLMNADLSEAFLFGTNLSGAFLCDARLVGTILIQTDLRNADLTNAKLIRARLNGRNLHWNLTNGADQSETQPIGADLSGTNLRWADLSKADVTKEQLSSVASLEGATMPDGKIYDPAVHGFTTQPEQNDDK